MVLLIFGVAAVAFPPKAAAQFSWRLFADINVRLASWNIPTGEKTEKLITYNNMTFYNNAANNPTGAGRGDYTYTSGTLDLFNYYRAIRLNEFRLIVQYNSDAITLYTNANLNNMFRPGSNSGTGGDELADGHSFVQGSGKTPDWGDFLRYSFYEWYVRGNLGFLTAYVGNLDDRGKVNILNPFSDDLLLDIKVDHYSVNTPTENAADYQNNGNEVNNLFRSPNTVAGNFSTTAVPYIMLAARFDRFGFPLTFQIAADPGNNNFTAGVIDYKRFGGAVRISGENVANRITFDAVYRINGGDSNTLDNYDEADNPFGTRQPDGQGIFAHRFGVFANILNVPYFAFGFGYNGYLKVFEDTLSTSGKTTTKSGPLFSGIDLRLQYTRIPDTTLTFHSNVSFANTDKTTADAVSVGVWGQNLPLDNAQNWFALYNALDVRLRWNNQLSFTFQIANRLGIVTTTVDPPAGEAYAYKRQLVKLGGGGYFYYQFHRDLLLLGGVSFTYTNNSYSNSRSGARDNAATRDTSGGSFEIGIPIRLRLYLRS